MNPDILHLATGLVSCALVVNLRPGDQDTHDKAQQLVDELIVASNELSSVELGDMNVMLASIVASLLCTGSEDPAETWINMVDDLFAEFGLEIFNARNTINFN